MNRRQFFTISANSIFSLDIRPKEARESLFSNTELQQILKGGLIKNNEVLNVREFGAIGNGITDDTLAIQAALNNVKKKSIIFFPAGIYIITDKLHFPDYVTVVGIPSVSYIDFINDFQKWMPSYNQSASIIQYAKGLHGTVAKFGKGVFLEGLTFRVGQNRTKGDIFTSEASNLASIINCKFENFHIVHNSVSSQGFRNIQGSRFFACGSVLQGSVVDTIFSDNTITACKTAVHLTKGSGAIIFRGNRFEWCIQSMHLFESRAHIITGNVFDANEGSAILLESTSNCTFVGNLFWRNGRLNRDILGKRSHLHIKARSTNNVFYGNTFKADTNDVGKIKTPVACIELEGCPNALNQFKNNSTKDAYCTKFIIDTYSNSINAIDIDQVHVTKNNGGKKDNFANSLSEINNVVLNPVQILVYNDRIVDDIVDLQKIKLEGIGKKPIFIKNGLGRITDIYTYDNINYGGLIYRTIKEKLFAQCKPNEDFRNGGFAIGKRIYNLKLEVGQPIGWINISNFGQMKFKEIYWL